MSDGADGITLVHHTDYNESFFVRHAYFLGANYPYSALKTTLKAEIDSEAWATLHSDISPVRQTEERPDYGQGHQPPRHEVMKYSRSEVMQVLIASTLPTAARLTGEEQKAAKMTAFDHLNAASPPSSSQVGQGAGQEFLVGTGQCRYSAHRPQDREQPATRYVNHHDKAYKWAEAGSSSAPNDGRTNRVIREL